jgi:iron complex transport system ATP-binding protein
MPGELMGIVGPNGSGKSTLIKAMSRLLTPKSGNIFVDEQDITHFSREELARLVAVVPQAPVLPEAFLSFEVVLMGRTPHLGLFHYEGQKDMEIAWEAMAATQTQHLAERRIGELSGGERQRLTIARALTQEPKIILLDEPTSHLDINYQIETLNLVEDLCKSKNLIAIAALHDLNLAAQYCDRLIMIDSGKIYAEGSPEKVITSQNVRDVYGVDVCIRPHPLNNLPTVLITASNGRSARVSKPEKDSLPI